MNTGDQVINLKNGDILTVVKLQGATKCQVQNPAGETFSLSLKSLTTKAEWANFNGLKKAQYFTKWTRAK